jgi:VWFA-related protein
MMGDLVRNIWRSERVVLLTLPVFAGLMTVLASECRASAQDPAPAASSQSGSNSGVKTDSNVPVGQTAATGRISIQVVVSDKQGHPVAGLQASDFTLLDNKQAQKLVGFRAIDHDTLRTDPVLVVIVVDMINTGFDTVARERQELATFLKEDGGELANPTSIAIFADSGVKVAKGSSQDGNALLEAFNKSQSELRIIGRNSGFYGAADRLQMSLSQLGQLAAFEATQPGRKMILVISPGWPLLARAGDESDLKQRNWVFNSIVQFTNGLREANIQLYCLDPFDLGRTNPFYYEGYRKGVSALKDATYPNLALQVLAEHSGGQVIIHGRDISGELNTAVRDASVSYELTFEAVPGDRPNEYHALQVQVDKPNITVHTNSGYYARTSAPMQLNPR